MMLQLSCKNCGASLEIDLMKPKIICKYCKAEYLVNELLTEHRIKDMDMYSRLEPVARNSYNLYRYDEAVLTYSKLLRFGQTEEDIARYNICLLGLGEIKPTVEFFKSIACLDSREIYLHIEHIKGVAKSTARTGIKGVVKSNIGIERIKGVYHIIRWYRPYKYMMDIVGPIKCSCGKEIGVCCSECTCGVSRDDILKRKRGRRMVFKFCMLLFVCIVMVLAIKIIFFHNL